MAILQTTEAFEPPKYIASLIAAVNDGAKSAQTGALAFTLVGLYLLATAFSTTDEDLLLQHTMPVSQIGVQVPAVFSFAIAPVVFLFIHTYTLIRYDMLAANLRHFRTDLQASVPLEADRERCRQLLANVEFVQARTAPRGSPLYSRLYRFVAWLMLAGFPVATFFAVQISSLRYQSNVVTETQQVCLELDLVLLVWFVHRHRQRGELLGGPFNVRWPLAWLLPMFILALDLFYLNAPGANNKTVRDGDGGVNWSESYKQPLDLVMCPTLQWGCRYLTVDHRTLVGHMWKPEAIADLRTGKDEPQGSLAAIEGIVLRSRSLRFAKFDESRLFAGDMIDSDLSHATFLSAQLQGVNLGFAHLRGADLRRANLSGANLSAANLSGIMLRMRKNSHSHRQVAKAGGAAAAGLTAQSKSRGPARRHECGMIILTRVRAWSGQQSILQALGEFAGHCLRTPGGIRPVEQFSRRQWRQQQVGVAPEVADNDC